MKQLIKDEKAASIAEHSKRPLARKAADPRRQIRQIAVGASVG